MMKRFLVGLLSVFAIVALIFGIFQWNQMIQIQEREKYFKKLSKELTKSLTPEQLIGQVIHIAIPNSNYDTETEKILKKFQPGGIILFGKNLGTKEEIKNLTNSLQSNFLKFNPIPLFISTDQEGGRVIRVKDGVTQFPSAMSIGQINNKKLAYDIGFVTSYELHQLGINLFFAPVLDINNNPSNPVINTRSFGSYLDQVIQSAIPFEQGAREGGSIPVIKHFPGHGDTDIDSHLGLPNIDKTVEELLKFELKPFQKAIQKGTQVIMTAHILFPKIDSIFPATLSKTILTKILKNQLKYQGLIITDALEMNAIDEHYKDYKPGVLSLEAGSDILLLTSFLEAPLDILNQLKKALENPEFKKIVENRVQRQIELKLKSGLFYNTQEKQLEKFQYYFQEVELKRDNYFKKLGDIKKINNRASRESIRSLNREILHNTWDKNFKNWIFLIKDPVMLRELKQNTSISVFEQNPKIIKEKLYSDQLFDYIVFDTNTNSDLEEIRNILKKYPNQKIILLHYGSPFLDFPKTKTIDILLSFSPTDSSKIALIQSIFQTKHSIRKPKLILKSTTSYDPD